MGNPHCVIFVPEADSVPLRDIGPRIEKHNAFPRKTNVEFVQVLDRDVGNNEGLGERRRGNHGLRHGRLRHPAVACALNGLTGRKVTVRLKGGDLFIEWAQDNHVYMTGPAAEVFTGDYPL
jgi:diaminopimelate epimerase